MGERYERSGPVEIRVNDGRIASIQPTAALPGKRILAMPSIVDAHNHARPLSSTSFACGNRPLETWLPGLAAIPPVDAYTAAAASFSRSLQGGATSVMVHLTRQLGSLPIEQEALEIARAAQDVGVSIALAISLRDRNPLVYDDHTTLLETLDASLRARIDATWLFSPLSIEEQLSRVESVADALAKADAKIDVQFGPAGVQWCSDDLQRAIAERSTATGRRVHMHLLETPAQRQWADRNYPDGVVRWLKSIGLLSPRLTLAHCVWARPAELAMLAENDTKIAVSTSSNLHLFSGKAPVKDMLGAGVDVCMGLDGCALDDDDDGLREMRLFQLLNHAEGFASGGLDYASTLKAACCTGRSTLGLSKGGVLAPGMPADMLLLDLSALDRDNLLPVDAADYLFSRAGKQHIVDAYVNGRAVIKNSRVQGVDTEQLHDTLRNQYRAGLPDTANLRKTWSHLEPIVAEHYRGCC